MLKKSSWRATSASWRVEKFCWPAGRTWSADNACDWPLPRHPTACEIPRAAALHLPCQRRWEITNQSIVASWSFDHAPRVFAQLKGHKIALDAARPVQAESVRRHLLLRLSEHQTETIVRVSNLLGDEE